MADRETRIVWRATKQATVVSAGSVLILLATLLATATTAGADEPPLESCSLTWEDTNDGTDSKNITVTIAGVAPRFALVLDGFLGPDYIDRVEAGTTTVYKRNHDNDWNYLSARPLNADGTKGEWVVCGNTSIFGPDLPRPVVKSSVCSVIGDVLQVTGVNAIRIETRTPNGDWAFLKDRSTDRNRPDRRTIPLTELGVGSAQNVRFFDLVWGFPRRAAQEPTMCEEPVDSVDLPTPVCRRPAFYLGARGQNIIGTKASAAATADIRVIPRYLRFRIADAAGNDVSGIRAGSGGMKVRDIAAGTYTVYVRYIAQPIPELDLDRPRSAWIECGTVLVPK